MSDPSCSFIIEEVDLELHIKLAMYPQDSLEESNYAFVNLESGISAATPRICPDEGGEASCFLRGNDPCPRIALSLTHSPSPLFWSERDDDDGASPTHIISLRKLGKNH